MQRDKHQGAKNELIAVLWLLDKGYEVFRNVSQVGIIDLVVVNPGTGEFIFFDVKRANYNKDGSLGKTRLSQAQLDAGVKLLYVTKDNKCFIDETPLLTALPMGTRNCDTCGRSYGFIHSKQKYCSKDCSVVAYRIRNNIPMPKRRDPKKKIKTNLIGAYELALDHAKAIKEELS